MSQLEELIQRRKIEDEAIKLGDQRRKILQHQKKSLDANAEAISALLDQAGKAGVGIATIARLTGVTRATLYHWHDTHNPQSKRGNDD